MSLKTAITRKTGKRMLAGILSAALILSSSGMIPVKADENVVVTTFSEDKQIRKNNTAQTANSAKIEYRLQASSDAVFAGLYKIAGLDTTKKVESISILFTSESKVNDTIKAYAFGNDWTEASTQYADVESQVTEAIATDPIGELAIGHGGNKLFEYGDAYDVETLSKHQGTLELQLTEDMKNNDSGVVSFLLYSTRDSGEGCQLFTKDASKETYNNDTRWASIEQVLTAAGKTAEDLKPVVTVTYGETKEVQPPSPQEGVTVAEDGKVDLSTADSYAWKGNGPVDNKAAMLYDGDTETGINLANQALQVIDLKKAYALSKIRLQAVGDENGTSVAVSNDVSLTTGSTGTRDDVLRMNKDVKNGVAIISQTATPDNENNMTDKTVGPIKLTSGTDTSGEYRFIIVYNWSNPGTHATELEVWVETELSVVKAAAEAELDSYLPEGATQGSYTPENWQKVLDEREKGKTAIEAATDEQAVQQELEKAKAAIDGIEKITADEDLPQYKEQAIAAINAAVTKDQYDAFAQNSIDAVIKYATIQINAPETLLKETVDTYKNDAISKLQSYLTSEQVAAADKTQDTNLTSAWQYTHPKNATMEFASNASADFVGLLKFPKDANKTVKSATLRFVAERDKAGKDTNIKITKFDGEWNETNVVELAANDGVEGAKNSYEFLKESIDASLATDGVTAVFHRGNIDCMSDYTKNDNPSKVTATTLDEWTSEVDVTSLVQAADPAATEVNFLLSSEAKAQKMLFTKEIAAGENAGAQLVLDAAGKTKADLVPQLTIEYEGGEVPPVDDKVASVNNAGSAEALQTIIEENAAELGLDLAGYNTLTEYEQLEIVKRLFTKKPGSGYTKESLKESFDYEAEIYYYVEIGSATGVETNAQEIEIPLTFKDVISDKHCVGSYTLALYYDESAIEMVDADCPRGTLGKKLNLVPTFNRVTNDGDPYMKLVMAGDGCTMASDKDGILVYLYFKAKTPTDNTKYDITGKGFTVQRALIEENEMGGHNVDRDAMKGCGEYTPGSITFGTPAVEKTAIEKVNEATDAAALKTVIEENAAELGLDLAAYNALDDGKKSAVMDTVFAQKPEEGYSADTLKTAFDAAVTANTPVPEKTALEKVNEAADADALKAVIEDAQNAAALGIDLAAANGFNALSAAGQTAVLTQLAAGKPYDTEATFKQAFDAAVAAKYAEEHPALPEYKLGDVNDDGSITIEDALLALQLSVQTAADKNSQQFLAADVNANGSVTVDDVLLILKKANGKNVPELAE